MYLMTDLATDQIFQVWKKFIKTREINTGTIREEVAESWKRCFFVHKLDPYVPKQPIRLSQEEIASARSMHIYIVSQKVEDVDESF